jgi:aminoglycoside phosphotransferase (APT) family kinase protein
MDVNDAKAVAAVTCELQDIDKVVSVKPLIRGHLNKTYVVEVSSSRHHAILLQKINHRIFQNVDGLMQNISLVIEHVRRSDDYPQSAVVPGLLSFRDGAVVFRDSFGSFWRSYEFVEESESFDTIPDMHHAQAGASLCGAFLAALKDLDPGGIIEVLPGFQDSRNRFETFRGAIENGLPQRVERAQHEIDCVKQAEAVAVRWRDPTILEALPLRVVHNDFKLNNVLFRKGFPVARAVIDLDSCMPGVLYYDFGDLVRSTLLSVPEDSTNYHEMKIDTSIMMATVRGFVEGIKASITSVERVQLVDAPAAIAFTLAARFLTDYLQGDTYFGATWQDQNLQRARVQYRLGQLLEEQTPFLKRLLND